MEDMLPFLMRVMGARDPYAQNHADHVAEMAISLARAIDLSAERTQALEIAATIHDIGKIAINDSVINKPGRFTEAEYIMVQHHTVMGANLIEPLNLNPIILNVILQHHENFDGTGYPGKLSGPQILLEARILRIVDTYDALTHHRIYRRAYTPKQAVEIMEKEHAFFDPNLLGIFFQNVNYQA